MELHSKHLMEEWLDYEMSHLVGYWFELHSKHLMEDYEMAQLKRYLLDGMLGPLDGIKVVP